MARVDDSLAAHARRRAARVPTISVLVGDESAGLAAIRRWAIRQGRLALCVEGRSGEEARQNLLARTLRLPGLEARALVALARELGRPAEEVQRSLAGGPERDQIRSTLDALPPRASAAFTLIARAGARDGWSLLENLTALLELFAPAWPCLIMPGPRTSVLCLRQVEAWVAAAPALPACLVLDGALWSVLEANLEGTRLLGMLREGFVAVEAAPGETEATAPSTVDDTSQAEHTGSGRDQLTPEAAFRVLELEDSPPEERERARSVIEAFLFQLLELRTTTVGLFELNVKLDFTHGSQRAEVDLLCASLRVALEVDGYHHFADRAAVRRDRRKDLLLQRHGYVVVRVLAEDVVPQMASVLRDIEDVLAWRRQQVILAP